MSKSKVRTRFAPSPTGMLHVGNARTAIINYLFAKSRQGEFILRIDDTDLARSTWEYEDAIIRDVKWLGIDWDQTFKQSSRLARYEEIASMLIEKGDLYPCFESQEELDVKRKLQMSRGAPPLYDRAALRLTQEQKKAYKEEGRRPHYRFKLKDGDIRWNDMVKGDIHYQAHNLGDPVLLREDGSMTYMLCSTIDDIDYEITDVVRGEDHVSNTAIQIQLFEALASCHPNFAHLSLIKAKEEKISKRSGGFEIANLRNQGIEPAAINTFFSLLGSSNHIEAYTDIESLLEVFDISKFSKSPTTYMPEELEQINAKIVRSYSYEQAKERFAELDMEQQVDEKFWRVIQPNLEKLSDIKIWYKICNEFRPDNEKIEQDFLNSAIESLPAEISSDSFSVWTRSIAQKTGKKGKELFLPIRIALTGLEEGPELKLLFDILPKQEIIKRLSR